ncbi:MAG: hypothetical protein DME33_04230 [Verrucomicrobia bacterium]|nr:MAG: hypothetical protein DME33_04230 [Verrucomicrobiota bacterium]
MECGFDKIPCLYAEVPLQSGATFMICFARLSGRRSFIFGFIFPATLLAAALVQKNPPVRPADADSPVLIWDIDLKLANTLPRTFRTTDDPLKATTGERPATTGLSDLRTSGSGEFTAEGLELLLART